MKLVWQYFALTVTWRILIIKLEYSRHVVVLEYINILIYLLQPGSSPNLGSNWNLFSVFWEVDFLAALKITKNTSEIEIWSRKIHSRISNVETRKPASSGVGDFRGDWTFSGGFWIYFGFEWKLGAGSVFWFFSKTVKVRFLVAPACSANEREASKFSNFSNFTVFCAVIWLIITDFT